MSRSNAPEWVPVLHGSDAARALDLAAGIASALCADESEPHLSAGGASFAGGWSGIALALDAVGDRTGAESLADRAIQHAGEAAFDARLFVGHPGIAHVLDLLAGDDHDDEGDGDVDEVVAKLVVSAAPWPGSYDLIQGLVGIGTYALARARRVGDAPGSTSRWTVEKVTERLAEIATETPDGTTWFTRIETLPVRGDRASRYPGGYFDVGLAHGVAGVVTFLAGAAGDGVPAAAALLRQTVPWLLATRIDDARHGHAHAFDADGSYPLLFGPGEDPEPGRIGWCYGDPSVAVALLAAGRALGDSSLVDEARRVALLAARRPREASGVSDAMLCHGSAGLAHVFSRLGQQLADDELLAAARWWHLAVIAAHDPDAPLGGFLSYRAPKDGEPGGYAPVAGLLEGSAGIALALVAASSPGEPAWDELLLLRPVAAAGAGE